MFKNVPRRGSPGPRSPAIADEDNDAISVTSTISDQHGSEDEFGVANLLAEKTSDGETFYLVEWDGFALDECTWEPAVNLGSELREMWEETKRKQQSGEETPFNLQDFADAVNKSALEKQERRRRRNAKRKRLGLEVAEPISDDRGGGKETLSGDDGSDEAQEDHYFDNKASEDRTAHRGEPPIQRSSSIPRPKPPQVPRSPGKATTETRHQSSQVLSRKAPPAPPPTSSFRRERPSATGYQGTARNTASKPTTNGGSHPLNAAAVARGTVPGRSLQTAGRHVYTAKKSGAATKAIPNNVFIGGTTRKPRSRLQDALTDSTKEEKLFQKYRQRRLAEKGSRDKEDRPPDLQALSANLFDITKGPSARKASKESLARQGHGQQETRIEANPTTSNVSKQLPPSLSMNDGQSKKKRKSVRFLPDEAGSLYSEPMNIDPPATNVQKQRPLSITTRPQSNVGNSRLERTQSINKSLNLGSNAAPIAVTIYGLPLEAEGSWLAEFRAKDTLDCYYSCFAKTFADQINHFRQRFLCAGAIKSAESEHILEAVAARLRAGVLGLYYSHPEYNLIVYPARCDEWKWLADTFASEPSSPNESALKYLVFSSTSDCGPFLRPLHASRTSHTASEKETTASPLDGREFLVQSLLGLKYADLLAPALVGKDVTHNFFLMLPQSKGDVLQALYHWLRACNSDCRVYTSHHPGGWSAFRSAVEKEPGVVIVHELLSWSLHRFPSLQLYLNQSHDVYWCLSEASHPHPIFPSSAFPDETVPPGRIHFTRLFPDRTAILVTPSFLTSEPQRTSELLSWVLSNWTKGHQVVLLSAWNLRGYLDELAHERSEARHVILQQSQGIIQNEIRANLQGLSQLDCEERYKALLLAAELDDLHEQSVSFSAVGEEASPLIYADPSIDPNDEQSLVNWFGWWSTLRMDQFRGFHVVGSSQAMKYKGSKKGARLIRPPKYTQWTINSPDIVMDTVQQKYEPVEAQELDDSGGSQPDLKARDVSTTTVPVAPWTFQSKYFPREDSVAFTVRLRALEETSGKGFMTLYAFPVSWTDSDMAQHFRDFHEEFRTMKSWFKFSWSFVHPAGASNRARNFNTYVGFFYTISEEWDPENPPHDARPRRHPWLAIYRPVNPHQFYKPYTRCELIIWDPAAADKFPGPKVPREGDLIYAQRRLIQLVREQGPEKNPGTWLDQVWFGGPQQQQTMSGSTFPIDITVDFLGDLLKDTKRFLPALESHLPSQGFKLVALGNDPSLSRQGAGRASSPSQKMDIDLPGTDDDDNISEDADSRIIFHPPRGRRLIDGQHTQCYNRLYEEACLARTETGAESTEPGSPIAYEFQHTLEWYEAQVAEGRGYGHVNVASWEAIFNTFRIASASRPTTSGEESGNSVAPAGDSTTGA